jgi:integrase
MSSIRKRGKIWFLDVRIGEKRIRESLGTSDKRVAAIKAKIRERELLGGAYSKPITLQDFAEEYLVWAQTRKAKGTIQADRSCLERLRKTLDITRLDQLTVKKADWFIAEIAKAKAPARGSKKKPDIPMSPAGVNYYIRTLRSIFSTAVKWKYLIENPFKEVKLLKVELGLPRVLNQREIASLIMTTKHHYPHLVDLFHIYLLTGLRRSEALRLQWTDVDFEKNILIVRRTKAKRVRIVPILPKAREILLARRELPRPFSFKPDYVTDKFTKIATQAGIAAKLHDLRRTFGSNLLSSGVPREVVQKLLGHADFATTDTYYFGLNEDVIRSLSKIDLLISSN